MKMSTIITEEQGFPPPCKDGCYNLVAIKVWFHSRVLGLALYGCTGRSGPSCGCLPKIIGGKAIASADLVPGKVTPATLLHASPSLPSSGFQNMIACLEGPSGKL